ncbi:MAG: hypothetical protein H8D23_17695 [Candidatus Brocadiales bacterium]|nr:hypothetical protein [Candidatus Brocadiales bacterium]
MAITISLSLAQPAPAQTVIVAKTNGDYSTIQGAIDSISDAASDKIYVVSVYPGTYTETVTLKSYVNIIAFDTESTNIIGEVKDNSVACICALKINITNVSPALVLFGGGSTINYEGELTSTGSYGIQSGPSNTIIVKNSTITTEASSRAISVGLQNIILRIENSTINGEINIGANCSNIDVMIKNSILLSSYNACFNSSALSGTIKLDGVTANNTYNDASGDSLTLTRPSTQANILLNNVKATCLHASAEAIGAGSTNTVNISATNCWIDRALGEYVTNTIAPSVFASPNGRGIDVDTNLTY